MFVLLSKSARWSSKAQPSSLFWSYEVAAATAVGIRDKSTRLSLLKICVLSVSPRCRFGHADGFDSAIVVVWKTARHSPFVIRQMVAQLPRKRLRLTRLSR
jgi:hypothetical protein